MRDTDRQVVVWLDNWYRKRFGTDPQTTDMSLNVSVLAVLHVTELPVFPGHPPLCAMVDGVPKLSVSLVEVLRRINHGVAAVNDPPLQREWIRVPLDVQRTGMRSRRTRSRSSRWGVSSTCWRL